MTPEETRKRIGEKLKVLRAKKGYTNSDYFADEHDLNKSTLAKVEKGESYNVDSLLKYLKALKVTPEEFFKGIK
jgi:transcriptional regulator with XRE-family HTH domain